MEAVKTKIGPNEILIKTIDEDIEVFGYKNSRATITSSITEDIEASWEKAKNIVSSISEEFKQTISNISKANQPKQIEIEFTLGFSAKTGMWIVTGEGSCGLKFKLVWEKGD